MGIVAWILVVIVVALAALMLYASTRPNNFALSRSAHINAPPARVYTFIENFRQWTHWSPWEKMDPALERTYSGAEKGVGAVYEWRGPKAGQGRMEITDAVPAARIALDLDFVKPFKAHNTVVFTLAEEGGGTKVTWAMNGEQAFMAKMMSVVVNMDKMMGGTFDEGLASMKRVSEAA